MATDDDKQNAPDDLSRVLNELDKVQGHDEPCAMCGKPCDSLAADPGKWPLAFVPTWRADFEPGRIAWHCTRCVMNALAALRDLVDAVDRNVDLGDPLTAAKKILGQGWGVWCGSCSMWTYSSPEWAGWSEPHARRMAARVSTTFHQCEARRLPDREDP